MNQESKMAHNLQLLTTAKDTLYLYVPVHFGHLSAHQYRVKVIEQFSIPDGNGKKIYKVLEVLNDKKTRTRRILWWHKLIKKGKRGKIYEYSFETYGKRALADLKGKEKSNDSQSDEQTG